MGAVVFFILTDDSDDGAGLQVDGRDGAGAGVCAIEDLGAAIQAEAVERTIRDIDRRLGGQGLAV